MRSGPYRKGLLMWALRLEDLLGASVGLRGWNKNFNRTTAAAYAEVVYNYSIYGKLQLLHACQERLYK